MNSAKPTKSAKLLVFGLSSHQPKCPQTCGDAQIDAPKQTNHKQQ